MRCFLDNITGYILVDTFPGLLQKILVTFWKSFDIFSVSIHLDSSLAIVKLVCLSDRTQDQRQIILEIAFVVTI